MAKNVYDGVISDFNSRISVFWSPEPPAGTFDTQWHLDQGSLTLYDNSSEPWKNMQTVGLLCEFDSSTNLSPGPGGFDPRESPGTDPRPLLVNTSNVSIDDEYVESSDIDDITDGEVIASNQFQTSKDLGSYTYIASPSISEINDYYTGQLLQIKTLTSSNRGYYIIESVELSGSDYIITIDPDGDSGSLSTETSLIANILRYAEGGSDDNPTGAAADLQTQLQSGQYKLNVRIHAAPSREGESILHQFELVPFWLLTSKLFENRTVPIWSFTMKAIVREVDISGATFGNYWTNLNTDE